MCLGVPGRVIEWLDHDPVFGRAAIEFDGVRRVCHMACVPDANVGEYVVVHAGIAISRIDTAEAQRVIDELRLLGLNDDFPDDDFPDDDFPDDDFPAGATTDAASGPDSARKPEVPR